MTQREMKAFLKAEGWYPRIHPVTGRRREKGWMVDPHTWDSWGWGLVREAYRLAHRRKSQRERARLRRAGFRKAGDFWVAPKTHIGYLGRAEALSTLEAP
jgi:hypothetical protein